jgi:opacity protein-like surface antigen
MKQSKRERFTRSLARPASLGLIGLVAITNPAHSTENQSKTSLQKQKEPKQGANERKGFYITGSIGGGWQLNQTGTTPVTSYAGVGYRIDTDQVLSGGSSIETGLGHDFGKYRTELTYVRNNQTINSSQATLIQRTISAPLATNTINAYTNSNSLFASAYYDFTTKSKLTPYIGGGLGVTQINWGGINASGYAYNLYQSPGASTALGYQGKVGASYELSKSVDAFLEGTYQGASSFSIGRITSGSPNQSGVNYNPMNLFGARVGIRIRL